MKIVIIMMNMMMSLQWIILFLGKIILLLIFTVKIILMMKIYIQKH